MKSPYRESGSKPASVKLNRPLARIRGFIRRIFIPSVWVIGLGVFASGCFGTCAKDAKFKILLAQEDLDNDKAKYEQYKKGWEEQIQREEKELNNQRLSVAQKEAQLNMKIQVFETIMSMPDSALKNKDTNEILKKNNLK